MFLFQLLSKACQYEACDWVAVAKHLAVTFLLHFQTPCFSFRNTLHNSTIYLQQCCYCKLINYIN